MDAAVAEQLLDEMLSSLEDLETKTTATLLYLKDTEHVSDKDLAPYLEQAGRASNVRWRAARLRMMSLLSSALKSAEEPAEMKDKPKHEEGRAAQGATQKPRSETATEAKPSADVPPQSHAETNRPQDKTPSESKEPQAPESKDQQKDEERKGTQDRTRADAKSAQETPQKGAA